MTDYVVLRDKVNSFPTNKQNEEFKKEMKTLMEKVKKDNVEMTITSRNQIEII